MRSSLLYSLAQATDDGLAWEEPGKGGGSPSQKPLAVGQLPGEFGGGERQGPQEEAWSWKERSPSPGQEVEA